MTRIALIFLAFFTLTFLGCGEDKKLGFDGSESPSDVNIKQFPDEAPPASAPGPAVAVVPDVVPVVTPVIAPPPPPPPPPPFIPPSLIGFPVGIDHPEHHGGGHDRHDRIRCEESSAPTCGGHCPLGQECVDVQGDCECLLPPRASISLTKTGSPAVLPAVGQQITYTFTITNGPVPLSNVNLIETFFSGEGDISAFNCNQALPASLAPGAVVVCTATYTVQAGDVGEDLINSAEAFGTDPRGNTVLDEANFNIEGGPAIAAISLAKEATPTEFTAVGETISYTFTATNTGNLPLTNVTIVDPVFTGDPDMIIICPAGPITLQPGQTVQCTGTYVVTPVDLDRGFIINWAEATGNVGTAQVKDGDFLIVLGPQRLLSITKAAESISPEGLIEFEITVTNESSVVLTNVDVSDLIGTPGSDLPLTCVPPVPLAALPPGGIIICTNTAPYQVTPEDVAAGSVTDTATASADGIDDVEFTLDVPVAATFSVAKELVSITPEGDIVYGITVTNTGNLNLENVDVTDLVSNPPSDLPLTCVPPVPLAILAPGASIICNNTVPYQVTPDDVLAGSVTDTATATADFGGVALDPVSDSVNTPLLAALSIDKEQTLITPQGQITYGITVTNTGALSLDVDVTDLVGNPQVALPLTCVPPVPAILLPGASILCNNIANPYQVTQADLTAGSVTNTATATGDFGGVEVDQVSDAVVTPVAACGGVAPQCGGLCIQGGECVDLAGTCQCANL